MSSTHRKWASSPHRTTRPKIIAAQYDFRNMIYVQLYCLAIRDITCKSASYSSFVTRTTYYTTSTVKIYISRADNMSLWYSRCGSVLSDNCREHINRTMEWNYMGDIKLVSRDQSRLISSPRVFPLHKIGDFQVVGLNHCRTKSAFVSSKGSAIIKSIQWVHRCETPSILRVARDAPSGWSYRQLRTRRHPLLKSLFVVIVRFGHWIGYLANHIYKCCV